MFDSSRVAMPTPESAPRGRSSPILPADAEHYLFSRPLNLPYPAGLEIAVFGLGCFWGAERLFWQLGDGIWITAVGYAGGYTQNPTYEEVCSGRTGHTEAVVVVFDSAVLPYETLLKTFWEAHDPTQDSARATISGRSTGRRFTRRLPNSSRRRKPHAMHTLRLSRERVMARSRQRSRPPAPSIWPRAITSSIWRRCRTAIAGSPERA